MPAILIKGAKSLVTFLDRLARLQLPEDKDFVLLQRIVGHFDNLQVQMKEDGNTAVGWANA